MNIVIFQSIPESTLNEIVEILSVPLCYEITVIIIPKENNAFCNDR